MTLEAVREPAQAPSKVASKLIAQPDRPALPVRVPTLAECGGALMRAYVIGSTEGVLLLQSADGTAVPSLGTPMRLKIEWDSQVLTGRIAAHGVAGRYLVSLGERPIRRSRRFTVDLPGIATCVHLYGPTQVRITDLSTGGARVRGLDLPIGTDVELQFTPPGQPAPMTVLGFVVRSIAADEPTVGVAFRMVQPSMDSLAKTATSR